MTTRFDYKKENPEAFAALLQLEQFMKGTGLDLKTYELIKIRASQINGCAYCLDMHTKEMLKIGETTQRINLISVWHETGDLFTEKEKAVLELTEAVTLISNNGVKQSLYERVREFFTEKEYTDLIMAINTINCWNRMAISTGMYPTRSE